MQPLFRSEYSHYQYATFWTIFRIFVQDFFALFYALFYIFFQSLLSQQLDKHPIIILKDVTFAELKLLIDYMYKGKVSTSIQDLAGFVKAAQSLQIKGLSREENEQFINNTKASTSNCSKTSDTEANETVEPSVESESPSGKLSSYFEKQFLRFNSYFYPKLSCSVSSNFSNDKRNASQNANAMLSDFIP